LVVPNILASIIGLGIDQAVVTFPAKYKVESKPTYITQILRTALALKLIIGIGASIFCFLFAEFWATYLLNNLEVSPYIRIASSLVLFQTLWMTIYSAFIGLDRTEASSITKMLMAIVKALAASILILLGLGVAGAVIGHIAGYAAASLTGAVILLHGPLKKLDSHQKTLKSMA